MAGFPVVDVEIVLTGGAYSEADSNDFAFKIAGYEACKTALRNAKPTLLEPFMMVEIETPEQYVGDIIGNMNARRGRVVNMEIIDLHSIDEGKKKDLKKGMVLGQIDPDLVTERTYDDIENGFTQSIVSIFTILNNL